jgi:hypothetical protein
MSRNRRVPADLVILAKQTLQVAVRKKNITDPLLSADNGFFSVVNAYRGDSIRGIAFTEACSACVPVCSAHTWTKAAAIQQGKHGMVKMFKKS